MGWVPWAAIPGPGVGLQVHCRAGAGAGREGGLEGWPPWRSTSPGRGHPAQDPSAGVCGVARMHCHCGGSRQPEILTKKPGLPVHLSSTRPALAGHSFTKSVCQQTLVTSDAVALTAAVQGHL